MKVGTPLGEFPVEFKRVERREGAIAVIGVVAGMESAVVVDREDLRAAAKALALPAAAALALLVYSRTRG